MKKIAYFILLYLGILNLFSEDLNEDILEQAYFELSGIWGYDNVGDVTPLWVRSDLFSWGYVKDYDPEAGAIIDLGSSEKLIDLYKYSSIEKQGDLYKFRLSDENGYLYIIVRDKGKISYLDKPDSVTGDYHLKRLTGPDRELVNEVGTIVKASDLYILPSQESNVRGSIEPSEEVLIMQRTLKDKLVSEFIPWIKVKIKSGKEGWVLSDVCEINSK